MTEAQMEIMFDDGKGRKADSKHRYEIIISVKAFRIHDESARDIQ